jgi:hypothetical protein
MTGVNDPPGQSASNTDQPTVVSTTPNLQNLSYEVKVMIAKLLDVESLCALSSTSPEFYPLLTQENMIVCLLNEDADRLV